MAVGPTEALHGIAFQVTTDQLQRSAQMLSLMNQVMSGIVTAPTNVEFAIPPANNNAHVSGAGIGTRIDVTA